MENWKRRLLGLHSEERAREEAAAEESKRVADVMRSFLVDVAYPALNEVEAACRFIDREATVSGTDGSALVLDVYRWGQPELSLELEVTGKDSALLYTRLRSGSGQPNLDTTQLVQSGETLADLSVERVRNAVVEVLEKRLRGEL
jgi:hypothetical protein